MLAAIKTFLRTGATQFSFFKNNFYTLVEGGRFFFHFKTETNILSLFLIQ